MQLLVARYGEPARLVRRLLDSVALQQGFDMSDVSVIVANDGPDALPEEAYGGYPFEVMHMTLPHRGVSATRNALLDASWDDLLMVCDADDMFHSMVGLNVARAAMSTGADVFVPAFLEETADGMFVTRDSDPFMVHGKVFRRDYLLDEGIRWHESLPYSGDNYFLWQALTLTDKVAYSRTSYYAWMHNPKSICRHEEGHFLKSLHLAMRSHRLLVENMLGRGRRDLATRFAVKAFSEAWFMEGVHGGATNEGARRELGRIATEHADLLAGATDGEWEAQLRERRENFRWDGPEGGIIGLHGYVDVIAQRYGEACGH